MKPDSTLTCGGAGAMWLIVSCSADKLINTPAISPFSPATDLPRSKAFCSATHFILHILYWYRRHFTKQDKKDHVVGFFFVP